MDRKRITASIKGRIEYMEPEEDSHFDKYKIYAENELVAFIYMPKLTLLVPRQISFTREIEVHQDF